MHLIEFKVCVVAGNGNSVFVTHEKREPTSISSPNIIDR